MGTWAGLQYPVPPTQAKERTPFLPLVFSSDPSPLGGSGVGRLQTPPSAQPIKIVNHPQLAEKQIKRKKKENGTRVVGTKTAESTTVAHAHSVVNQWHTHSPYFLLVHLLHVTQFNVLNFMEPQSAIGREVTMLKQIKPNCNLLLLRYDYHFKAKQKNYMMVLKSCA